MDDEALKGANPTLITKLTAMTLQILIMTHVEPVNHVIQLRKREETVLAVQLSCHHQHVCFRTASRHEKP